MQVHIPVVCGKDPYKVRLNEPGNPGTFAIIELATTSRIALWVESMEDADRLIAAACEAKRLLSCRDVAPHSGADTCGYQYAADGAVCARPAADGHVHAGADSHVPPVAGPSATPVPAPASADETAGSGEDEGVLLLDYDDAVALLADDERIHTFLQGPMGMLIGADWDRADVLALLRETDRREVTGPAAQSTGHGLAAYRADGVPVFIATAQAEASRP